MIVIFMGVKAAIKMRGNNRAPQQRTIQTNIKKKLMCIIFHAVPAVLADLGITFVSYKQITEHEYEPEFQWHTFIITLLRMKEDALLSLQAPLWVKALSKFCLH